MSKIYYVLFIFILGLLIFHKTFQLSLMGDEWQMIWGVKASLETTGQWDFLIKQFHWQGYQVGALLMHLLTYYFGYDGRAVYIFSFITRFAAALTLFYFFIRVGCSNTGAFIGSLLFMVTPIGLQTTDWAKNFTSYLSISFFILSIYFIYKLNSWQSLLGFLITYFVSLYINPIRAHGEIMTITLLLIIRLFMIDKNKKFAFFSFIGSTISIILLSKMQMFGNANVIQIGKLLIINFPSIEGLFSLVGKGIAPAPNIIYLGALIIIMLFWKNYFFRKKYLIVMFITHLFILSIFLIWFSSKSTEEVYTAIGLYFTLFLPIVLVIEIIEKKFLDAYSTVLCWSLNILFILTPWILGVIGGLEPTHRYLIYSAISIPVAVAFSLAKKDKVKSWYIVVPLLLIVAYAFSTNTLIDDMYFRHNQTTAKILWQQLLPYFDNFDFKNQRPLIQIDSDNPAVQETVIFGIDYRLGFMHKVWEENKLPISLDGAEVLKSMLTDGKSAKRFTGKEIIFPKENAFYFKISGTQVSRIDVSTLF